jgi:hypothetical protein
MKQDELDGFRTRLVVAKESGDMAQYKLIKIEFERRLHECQVHTGQRVERIEEWIKEMRDDIKELLGTSEDYQQNKRSLRDKIAGAKSVYLLLRYGGAAGVGAAIMKLLGSVL